MMAGVLPIGIAIEGHTCLYKRKHSIGKDEYEWDKPLHPEEWPHPPWRTAILEATNLISYPTEIFTDGSKTGDKVGAVVAIYKDKKTGHEIKIQTAKALLKQPSRTDCDSEVIGKPSYTRRPTQHIGGHIYRQ
jgi:hypothetical protein